MLAVERLRNRSRQGEMVHMAQAIDMLRNPYGYVESVIQDVLLQVYGNIDFSRELDARADAFR
eukprot:5407871-Karenia_brevis.AAC.1